jgi:hypothetical protein
VILDELLEGADPDVTHCNAAPGAAVPAHNLHAARAEQAALSVAAMPRLEP